MAHKKKISSEALPRTKGLNYGFARFLTATRLHPPAQGWPLRLPWDHAGCMADGSTYQEALANAEVVIHEWIEMARGLGRPIPEPKGRLIYA